jgi:hypothetical protein
MNGTIGNWLKHAALGAAIAVAAFFLPMLALPPLVAIVYFWAKEAGEKSKQWDAPGRPLSDWNFLGPRWSKDDRLDLFSGVAGAAVAMVALVLITGAR